MLAYWLGLLLGASTVCLLDDDLPHLPRAFWLGLATAALAGALRALVPPADH